jgi:hypothetical protein
VAAAVGKRMPLFPRAMRLSSDCLAWFHASQRSTSDPHVYYILEELEAPPLPRSRGARRTWATSTRGIAETLAASTEVSAVSIAGLDLRVRLPERDDGAEPPPIHLRPASVEHLLSVDCLWPRMDPSDRQKLSSCYTPRETPHACRLTTLYVPLSDGPQADQHADLALGTHRRLRPLRLFELLELLRIYAIREPQPVAATRARPLAPAHDERAAELRTAPDDEVLQHVYCTLTPPGSAPGGGGQSYILQLQLTSVASADSTDSELSLSTPPLVDLCQNGVLQEALRATLRLRKAGVVPPSLAVDQLKQALSATQKAASALTDLTQQTRRELSGGGEASKEPSPSARGGRNSPAGGRSKPHPAHQHL